MAGMLLHANLRDNCMMQFQRGQHHLCEFNFSFRLRHAMCCKDHSRNLTCSYSSIFRGCKPIPLWNYDGCNAQDTDHDQIDEAGLRVAVKRIIKPWDKTAHNEKSNPRIVQPKTKEEKKSFVENFTSSSILVCSLITPFVVLMHLTLFSNKNHA